MGGLCDERIGGVGRDSGDGSETGSVTDEQIEDQYQCQPPPGLQRQKESNNAA